MISGLTFSHFGELSLQLPFQDSLPHGFLIFNNLWTNYTELIYVYIYCKLENLNINKNNRIWYILLASTIITCWIQLTRVTFFYIYLYYNWKKSITNQHVIRMSLQVTHRYRQKDVYAEYFYTLLQPTEQFLCGMNTFLGFALCS